MALSCKKFVVIVEGTQFSVVSGSKILDHLFWLFDVIFILQVFDDSIWSYIQRKELELVTIRINVSMLESR